MLPFSLKTYLHLIFRIMYFKPEWRACTEQILPKKQAAGNLIWGGVKLSSISFLKKLVDFYQFSLYKFDLVVWKEQKKKITIWVIYINKLKFSFCALVHKSSFFVDTWVRLTFFWRICENQRKIMNQICNFFFLQRME